MTLTGLTVTDPMLTAGHRAGRRRGDADSDGVLDVGETWTYTRRTL